MAAFATFGESRQPHVCMHIVARVDSQQECVCIVILFVLYMKHLFYNIRSFISFNRGLPRKNRLNQ